MILRMVLIDIFDFRSSKKLANDYAQKSTEAEKEVVKLSSRTQETKSSLSKYQRDRDGKLSYMKFL